MRIKGVTLAQFEHCVNTVSSETYGGNLVVAPGARQVSKNVINARVTVRDSYKHGARMSARRRHMRAASWHAYRDVLGYMFAFYPEATVTTEMARYVGREGFEENYPATGEKNIGSLAQPVTMPELSV